MSRDDIEQMRSWCRRVSRWLLLHQSGALSKPSATLKNVLCVLEAEAVQGERLAALLEPGPARVAASRIVARLDCIIVDLSNQLLTEGQEDAGAGGERPA